MDNNDLTAEIPMLRPGNRIGTEYFNNIAGIVNKRRGSVSPPSQVMPVAQPSASIIAVADICSFGGGNKSASGSQTIDGTSSSTLLVLLTDQTTASQNGLYLANTSTGWTKQTGGQIIAVKSGTANARLLFLLTSTNTYVPIFGSLT